MGSAPHLGSGGERPGSCLLGRTIGKEPWFVLARYTKQSGQMLVVNANMHVVVYASRTESRGKCW